MAMFQDPGFRDTFRVLPTYFRVIGFEEDPGRPTRPHIIFGGEVSIGQTIIGRTEMTPDDQLRWKWVRWYIYWRHQLLTNFLGLRGGWPSSLEVPYFIHIEGSLKG